MGVNAFTDLTFDEFTKHHGTQSQVIHESRRLGASKKARTERYEGGERESWAQKGWDANNYEWLDAQPDCITADWLDARKVGKVKKQGECGSCYAHSTVAAIETLAAQEKLTFFMSEVPSYSEQQIVDCTMVPNFGCFGGDPKHAFDYIRSHGLASSEEYPYLDKF